MVRKGAQIIAAVAVAAGLSISAANARSLTVWPTSTSADVTAAGNDERADFMRRVYEAQVERAREKRHPTADLPKNQLEVVEGGHMMRVGAAEQCRLLLRQARADLRQEKEEGNLQALVVSDISIHSAYRNVADDAAAWRSTFKKHLKATRQARAKLSGGEYGDEAVKMMVSVMRRYKAAPGFSRHTHGLAVDFKTTESNVTLASNSGQNRRWRKTWLYKWLVNNAHRFKFKTLPTEAWHWEYTR